MDEAAIMRLDPAIRDWVLLPILAIMLLVGILRHNLTLLFTNPPSTPPSKGTIREQRSLQRTNLLRANASHIPSASFHARRKHFIEAFSQGAYLKDPSLKDAPPPNPITDAGNMDVMMEGMKRNMVMVIPQTVIMGWVTYFFSGFVLVRLPFPLTVRFKEMLQRGVDTWDMDARWVSSLSWYFLCLFGLRGVFAMVLGEENAADGMKDMQAMSTMGMGAAQPGQVPDWAGMMRSEKENLELLTKHDWDLGHVEKRLLKLYSKSKR